MHLCVGTKNIKAYIVFRLIKLQLIHESRYILDHSSYCTVHAMPWQSKTITPPLLQSQKQHDIHLQSAVLKSKLPLSIEGTTL